MTPDRNGGSVATEIADWRDRTRVFLQPIAPPSILGLFGFAGATFIVAAHLAGWYGNADTPPFLAPFAATFGGIAQFAAGMWAHRARDGLGSRAFDPASSDELRRFPATHNQHRPRASDEPPPSRPRAPRRRRRAGPRVKTPERVGVWGRRSG